MNICKRLILFVVPCLQASLNALIKIFPKKNHIVFINQISYVRDKNNFISIFYLIF